MKLLLALTLSLFSVSSFAAGYECVQEDDDNYYQVAFDGKDMAVIFNSESSDIPELLAFHRANLNADGDSISGGAYQITGLQQSLDPFSYGTLTLLRHGGNVELTNLMDCSPTHLGFSLNNWVMDNASFEIAQ